MRVAGRFLDVALSVYMVFVLSMRDFFAFALTAVFHGVSKCLMAGTGPKVRRVQGMLGGISLICKSKAVGTGVSRIEAGRERTWVQMPSKLPRGVQSGLWELLLT